MNGELKIIILEDLESDLKLLKAQLKNGGINFEYRNTCKEDEFLELLNSYKPDLILSDYSMPMFNGMQALKISKSIDPNVPFILVTGSLNEEIAVECMKNGADDYILKDNLKRINHAVETALKVRNEKLEKEEVLKALQDSEERYRRLIEVSPDAIIVHQNDIITFANQAAANLGGYEKPNELVGLTASSFVHTKYRGVVLDRIKNLSTMGGTAPLLEEVFVRKDGSLIDVEVSGIRFNVKGTNSILTIVRDITERKRVQRELLNAKERAEQSSKFKSTLMANMSHEFRTPMNGILGFAQILKEDIEDESKATMLDHIIRSGKRLMQTLNSILELSQLESERINFTSKIENLAHLIKNVTMSYEKEFYEKDVKFIVDIEDDSYCIKVDEEIFKQVITHLLDNALKFTSVGYVKVRSYKHIDENEEDWCAVDIIDTGIGIDIENHEKIFEPFRQASEGTNRHFEGSGLGLTIAKKMIVLLGGKILLTSEINKGSKFTILFPLVSSENVELITKKIIKDEQDDNVVEIRPNVLLVEDNFINKEVTILYLKDLCSIQHASNGEKAIKMAKDKIYDVVLMDINLGLGMDGVEVMKKIREFPGYENIPFVALTGYTMKEDRDTFYKEGFNYYLPKPFEKYELNALMIDIIKKHIMYKI